MQVVVKGSASSDNLGEGIHRKSNAVKGVCGTKDIRKTDCNVYSEGSLQFDKDSFCETFPYTSWSHYFELRSNNLKSVFYDSLIWLFNRMG